MSNSLYMLLCERQSGANSLVQWHRRFDSPNLTTKHPRNFWVSEHGDKVEHGHPRDAKIGDIDMRDRLRLHYKRPQAQRDCLDLLVGAEEYHIA